MRKRTLIAVVTATVLAGCGGAARHSGTSSEGAGSATSAGTTTTSGQSARQVIAGAVAAAKTVHSYRAQISFTDANRSGSLLLEVNSPTQLRVTEKLSSGVNIWVVDGPYTYLKAPRAYWAAQANVTPAQAALVGDRWLRYTNAQHPQLAARFAKLGALGTNVRCWSAHESDLTVTGSGTLNGKPVIILRSSGTAPGSAPGKVYVSTTDPKLPVKTVITGPYRQGGPPECRDTIRSETAIMAYNQHFQIAPPQGAIALR